MEDNLILDMFFERQEEGLAHTRIKYGKRMFMVAKNILHSNEDAEECINDALMKAWEAIPPTRPGMFGAYMVKIARNLSINKLEGKKAAKRGGGEFDLLLSELEDCIPSTSGPEAEYEAGLVTEAINMFLRSQKKTARAAFVLRYFHGESIADISGRFQMSESKIKSVLFRTRKKLAAHLEKEGVVL